MLLLLVSCFGGFVGGLAVIGDQWVHRKVDGDMFAKHTVAVGIILAGVVSAPLCGGLALSQIGLVYHTLSAQSPGSSNTVYGPTISSLMGIVAVGAWAVLLCVLIYVCWVVFPTQLVERLWLQDYDTLRAFVSVFATALCSSFVVLAAWLSVT